MEFKVDEHSQEYEPPLMGASKLRYSTNDYYGGKMGGATIDAFLGAKRGGKILLWWSILKNNC